MTVSITALKANPGKYLDLASQTDIVVTRRGKNLATIVGQKKTKKLPIESLIGCADFALEYADPDYDPDYDIARDADYRARGLLL